MNTPARTPQQVNVTWQASDPVLAALRAARAARDQANRDIRILLAYARELATPRPYQLAHLADASGISISGVRTAYTDHDVSTAGRILRYLILAQDAAQRSKDGGHDLRHPPC